MRRDRQMGREFNPASQAYWTEVRQEFQAVDANTMRFLETLAENSRIAAHNARIALRMQQQAEAAAARVADAPVAPVHFAQRAPCAACPSNDCICSRPIPINICVEQYDSGRNLQDVEQLDKDESHMRGRSPAVAAASVERYQAEQNKRIAELAREFEAKTSQGPRAPLHGDFPKKVRYQRCCGALCLQGTPWPTLGMYVELIKGFTICAQRFRSCVDLLAADVVLAIEVCVKSWRSGAICLPLIAINEPSTDQGRFEKKHCLSAINSH